MQRRRPWYAHDRGRHGQLGSVDGLRDLVGRRSYEELISEAAGVEAGSGGLVVLPYFVGERTPIFDPDARGLFLGLTLSHGIGHVYRAPLEATAYAVRHNLEVMGESAGGIPLRVVAVGGGTKGKLWPHIVSDVTGVAQELPRVTVGASTATVFSPPSVRGPVRPMLTGTWLTRLSSLIPRTRVSTPSSTGSIAHSTTRPSSKCTRSRGSNAIFWSLARATSRQRKKAR
jgi:FGGY family of carbohydrate kinases, C-terminal domain